MSSPGRPTGAVNFANLCKSLNRELVANLAIIMGNIENVTDVDIWVNSENTNIQMARFYEGSLSSTIRYYGARRKFKHIEEDLVADELQSLMGSVHEVDPGDVVVTGPGMLAESHNVKKVFHVAAVRGDIDKGYRQVDNVGRCVLRALRRWTDRRDKVRRLFSFHCSAPDVVQATSRKPRGAR